MSENCIISQILSPENMEKAKEKLGKPIGGVGLSKEIIEETWLAFENSKEAIQEQMEAMTWKPQPARSSRVKKKDGTKRIVLVPEPLDRLILEAATLVLEQIIKPLLSDSVFMFDRYNGVRAAHGKCLDYLHEGHSWAVQIDVENCSECLDRQIVMKHLRKIIREESALELYYQLMSLTDCHPKHKAPEIKGIYASNDLPTLLVDVCMMEVDQILDLQNRRYVRFGDDFMVFCDSFKEAFACFEQMNALIERQFNLSLNPAKSAIQHDRYGPFLGRRIIYVHSKKRCYLCDPKKNEVFTAVAGDHLLVREERQNALAKEHRRQNERERKQKIRAVKEYKGRKSGQKKKGKRRKADQAVFMPVQKTRSRKPGSSSYDFRALDGTDWASMHGTW